jgi:DNA helicase-2/ATP-dependent DNA helicase PcrA
VQGALAAGIVTGKPHENLTKFFYLYRTAARMLDLEPSSEVADFLLTQSGYRKMLKDKFEKLKEDRRHADAEKAERAMQHVNAVVEAVASYERRVSQPTLSGYLEEVSLITASDNSKGDKVLLSTVHGYKGLEADSVWVVGFEAGILPPDIQNAAAVNEEKRVAFVATSRARKSMTLTYAEERMRYGKWVDTGPSPFLGLISEECSDWPERDADKKQAGQVLELTSPLSLSHLSDWLD